MGDPLWATERRRLWPHLAGWWGSRCGRVALGIPVAQLCSQGCLLSLCSQMATSLCGIYCTFLSEADRVSPLIFLSQTTHWAVSASCSPFFWGEESLNESVWARALQGRPSKHTWCQGGMGSVCRGLLRGKRQEKAGRERQVPVIWEQTRAWTAISM